MQWCFSGSSRREASLFASLPSFFFFHRFEGTKDDSVQYIIDKTEEIPDYESCKYNIQKYIQ